MGRRPRRATRRAYAALVIGSGRFHQPAAQAVPCHTSQTRTTPWPPSCPAHLFARSPQDCTGYRDPYPVREPAQGVACWFTVYPGTGRGTYLPLAAMRCPVKASRTCVLRASESSSLSSPENSGSSLIIYQVASVIKMSHVFKLSSAKTCLKI